jgi:hypothetical protein
MITFMSLVFQLQLTQVFKDLEHIQLSAQYITEVKIEHIKLGDELAYKALPRTQIRGNNQNAFRVWLLGATILPEGRYVIFYNLCDTIAYPTIDNDSVLPVINERILLETERGPKKIRVAHLANWLSKHGFYAKVYSYECLPGRKGL